ncbi:MAG: hypothetical protein R3C56_19480 [Pirellulaceae bacterium]
MTATAESGIAGMPCINRQVALGSSSGERQSQTEISDSHQAIGIRRVEQNVIGELYFSHVSDRYGLAQFAPGEISQVVTKLDILSE